MKKEKMTKLDKIIDKIIRESGVHSQDFTQLVEKEVLEEAKVKDPEAYMEYMLKWGAK